MWWTPMSLDYYTSIAHELPAPVPAIMKPWIAQADDKFILCEGTKFWTGKSQLNNPAIVTVKELFEDANFINFNKIIIQTKIDTAIGVLTNKHSGLIVKPVPSLFLGKINNGTNVVAHSASAFNPGAANMQPVANKLYIPRQFAPLDNNTKDIFEDKIKTVLGNNIEFIDSWFYHVGVGNIHCGSTVKRSPPLNWWTKQPTTQP